ncbi:MAG: Uma2 family endonuclease [Thermoanaerobaculia bacterium]
MGADLLIPAEAHSFDGFRSWCHSERFPERWRIDYLAGEIEVDMSPEDAYTHGVVKSAIAAKLHHLISASGLGNVFIDRMRVSSPAAGLSVEPDVMVVLWSSLEAGRIREVSGAGRPGDRVVEFEGAPDLVVEIVSDSSARKDTRRLPPLYAAAGVPELWLVDARGDDVRFAVHELAAGAYRLVPPAEEDWAASPLLGCRVRLTRHRTRLGRWAYELEQTDS